MGWLQKDSERGEDLAAAASGELPAASDELAAALAALGKSKDELVIQQRLFDVALRVSTTLDRDEQVDMLLSGVLELMDADQGSVMLYDQFEQSLWIARAVGLPDEVVRTTVVNMGEGIAGWVAQTGKGMVINDPDEPASAVKSRRQRRAVRSAICVPMFGLDGRLYGVINAGSTHPQRKYSDADVAKLSPLADLGARALRNADELDESRRIFLDTLRALVLAIETKDPYGRGHTEHVTRYAVLLARKVALPELEVRKIELAALLHDIGKPAAGEAVLVQGRPLSALEQTLIRMHPKVAAQFLEEAPALGDVVPMIFHHHEHYDGTGYLEGLKGEDIPLGARILAVADAFSAMTQDRPYRKARSMDEALLELKAASGTQFDPGLVKAFLEVAEETPEVFKHKG